MSIVYRFLSSTWLFLITFDFHADGGDIDIEKHLEMGKQLLGNGQFADALSHYHAAVEGDPDNYLTYFKRATVFLAMGKSKSALPDLDKVIELKPDFLTARIQRGNVLLKQGKLDEAHIDFESVLRKDPNNMDALSQLHIIEPLKKDFQIADNLIEHKDYQGALSHLEHAVEICPWDPIIREMRAECFIQLGDFNKAINEIRPSTKLRPDNTDAYYQLSFLLYQIGRIDESLLEVRECLKLDPDHKICFPHYKKIKKLVKQLESVTEFKNQQRYEDCLAKAEQALKTESSISAIRNEVEKHICHCQMKAQNVQEAIGICSKVIEYDASPETICDRGEAYILDERFDEAVEDFQRAIKIDESLQRAIEGLQRAQKLLKQSKKKDYYKILGVKRTAAKREILKAYRKLAQKWHPDNFRQEGDDKKKAEKMFIDIAAAKEVLTDPEKRQKFDNGEDPLDPEQQGHGGQQFYGFNPFGPGFQFKFHFN